MSRATEIAEAEAEAAESEFPEQPEVEAPPEVEDESEALAEPEPPAPVDMEKALRALDKEGERHAKRVAEIMGDDAADLKPCPCCTIAGFVFPFMPESPDEWERKSAVDAYFSGGAPDLLDDPDTETCQRCDGQGELKTGAKRADTAKRHCTACGALGYVVKGSLATPGANGSPGETYTALDAAALGQPSGPDVWDRPPGHPHYGVPPALVTA